VGQLTSRHRHGALRVAPALVFSLVVLGACGGHAQRPAVSSVRALPPGARAARQCLRLVHWVGPEADAANERVGRLGRSVTLRAGPVVVGCDRAKGSRDWCAGVVGLLRAGQLVDPRLSLTCRDGSGATVAFAWVEPVRGARWLVVGAGGAKERVAVSRGLPTRVATRDVGLDSARFEVAQFGAEGNELERRRVLVRAAG
jgi:hypothetical protein